MIGSGEEWRAIEGGAQGYQAVSGDITVARAKATIDRIRKRDVVLCVVDRSGRQLANIPVEIVQQRGAFEFGDQLWNLDTMFRFGEHNYDRATTWMRRFGEVFNAANALCYWTERPRNDGAKSEEVQGDQRLDGFAWCVDWARAQGMSVKGHPLFWSIPKAVPDWIQRYPYETQMKFLEVRVRNMVARFKGKVTTWDAVNEPMWEPAFKNLASRNWPHLDPVDEIADTIESVLRWAREEDPDARYVVNDYGMEKDERAPVTADGTSVTAALQRKRFLQLLSELAARGAAPDAVGLQSHTGGWLDHQTQTAVYDEMATSGLPIHITEFWADTMALEKERRLSQTEIDEIQAEYVANYLTCAFGHEAVNSFFFWGFMDQAIRWHERSSHEIKPMFARVRGLLQEEWLTREKARTDAAGQVHFRGFCGHYSLRATHQSGNVHGVSFTVPVQRAAGECSLVIELPPHFHSA
jgi:GH35 family endo-1,4-beta-xylanase